MADEELLVSPERVPHAFSDSVVVIKIKIVPANISGVPVYIYNIVVAPEGDTVVASHEE